MILHKTTVKYLTLGRWGWSLNYLISPKQDTRQQILQMMQYTS